MSVQFNNKNYILHQFESESNLLFNKRKLFLEKNLSNLTWKKAVKISKIWSNIKFKKCRYNPKIYYYIKKFDNSI